MNSTTSFSGVLAAKVIRNHRKAPILWRIQNGIRPAFWLGWIVNMLAVAFSKVTGVPTMIAELRAVKIGADGVAIDYGVLSYRVVTSAGVGELFAGAIEVVLAGTLALSGAITRAITRSVDGNVTPTSAIGKAISRALSGAVGFAGGVATAGKFIGNQFRAMWRGLFKGMR